MKRIPKAVWWTATAAVVGLILALTLQPGGGPRRAFSTCLVCGDDGLADVIRNVVLFIPLGLTLAQVTRRRGRALLAAALLSVGIELTQQWLPGRDPSLSDILTNSTGAAIGLALATWPHRWARRSGTLALGAGIAAACVFVLSGVLLRPIFPDSVYFAQWTPHLGHLEWYRGRVLSATVGTLALPDGRLAESDAAIHLLAEGAPLRVRTIVGPPVHDLSSLFSIADADAHELLLLGPYGGGLAFRLRLRATQLRFDEPDLRLPGVGLGTPGDTVDVAAWRQGTTYCIAVGGVGHCRLGFTVGRGWALIFYPQSASPLVRSLLNLFWIGLLLAPIGFWFDAGWRAVAGAGVALAALALAPALTGLLTTPAAEWFAAVVGIAAGAGLRRTIKTRVAH